MPYGAKKLQTVPKSKSDYIYDIKTSIQFMSDNLKDLYQMKPEIQQIPKLVTKLQLVIEQKHEEMKKIENRAEELEQYSRQENIVISGQKKKINLGHIKQTQKTNALMVKMYHKKN